MLIMKYKNVDCISVGKRIQEHRENLHLLNALGKPMKPTQENLLVYMRERNLHTFGRNTLSNLENGKPEAFAAVTLAQWIDLCTVFGCSIGHLLGEYNCHDFDTQFIQNKTGLSECAINALQKYDKNVVDFISFLLESSAFVAAGLKASQCVDTKLTIKHYQADILPNLSIPTEIEKRAIKEWDISEQYLDIEQKRTKVMDEIKRLDTEYTALLWRCNQDFGVSIETFIDKEVKKYG